MDIGIGIVLAVFMTFLIMMPLIVGTIYEEEIDELINEEIDEEK